MLNEALNEGVKEQNEAKAPISHEELKVKLGELLGSKVDHFVLMVGKEYKDEEGDNALNTHVMTHGNVNEICMMSNNFLQRLIRDHGHILMTYAIASNLED